MSGTGDFMAAYTFSQDTETSWKDRHVNRKCSMFRTRTDVQDLHEPSQHLPQGKLSTKIREMTVVPDTKWAPNGNPRKLLTPSSLPWKAPYFLL